MSDDLVRRQAAIDEIKEIYEWHDNVTEARIIEHFKRMPSAQPEIIRCKDCKWFAEFCDEYKQESHKDGMCEHPKFGRYTLNTTFDYYCADGEVKSE